MLPAQIHSAASVFPGDVQPLPVVVAGQQEFRVLLPQNLTHPSRLEKGLPQKNRLEKRAANSSYR
jgi:hypothetical protein